MADARSKATEQLRLEMNSWSTIELRVRQDQKFQNKPAFVKDPFTRIEIHYIETAKGQRMLDDVTTTASGKKKRAVSYSDGDRCAKASYGGPDVSVQTRIEISKHFSSEHQIGGTRRPEPFVFYYVGKVPICEALWEARFLGTGRALSRDCDVFLFPAVKIVAVPVDLVYHLDQATSAPLRIEYFAVNSDRKPESRLWSWEARSLDRVQGDHSIPLRSESTTYTRGQGDPRPELSKTTVVEMIRYDQPFPSSAFWPTYGPGVEVVDTIKHTSFKVPGIKPEPKAEPKPVAVTSAPRAEQPTGWASTASKSAFGLGLALIIAALFLWRRYR